MSLDLFKTEHAPEIHRFLKNVNLPKYDSLMNSLWYVVFFSRYGKAFDCGILKQKIQHRNFRKKNSPVPAQSLLSGILFV